LAGQFKHASDKVTIAKIDATANDVPDDIQGFPTIKLFPGDKKDKPITFTGGRTVEELAKFVEESGVHKVAAKIPVGDEAASGVKESIKEKVSQAAEVVKDAIKDSDEVHDEL
jgi:protein disulfide-isomerase A1